MIPNLRNLESKILNNVSKNNLDKNQLAKTLHENFRENYKIEDINSALNYTLNKNPSIEKYLIKERGILGKTGDRLNIIGDLASIPYTGLNPAVFPIKLAATASSLPENVWNSARYGFSTGGYIRAAKKSLLSIPKTLGKILPGSTVYNMLRGANNVNKLAASDLIHEVKDYLEQKERKNAKETIHSNRIRGSPLGYAL